MQKLNHPNIIKLKNVFPLRNELILMIEYLPGGDLKQYLLQRENKRLNEDEVKILL